jgi:hypothetical protein
MDKYYTTAIICKQSQKIIIVHILIKAKWVITLSLKISPEASCRKGCGCYANPLLHQPISQLILNISSFFLHVINAFPSTSNI